jgi:hypothetical protein
MHTKKSPKCKRKRGQYTNACIRPTMGSLSLSLPLFLSRFLTLTLSLAPSLSLLLCCTLALSLSVVRCPQKDRLGSLTLSLFLTSSLTLTLSLSHSLTLTLSLSLSRTISLSPSRPYALALSLFLFSQPGRHRWKLSIGDARASERAMAATTARMLGACRHTRGNRFLVYNLATLKADNVLSL